MIPLSLPLRTLACAALLAAVPAPAATTTLTVHNRTSRTLCISQPWSPWHPEPDDPPRDPAEYRWCLRPGASATYRFQIPGREVAADLVIHHLHTGEAVRYEGLTIQAGSGGQSWVDPLAGPEPPCLPPPYLTPIGEDLPPEPEAPGEEPAPGAPFLP